MEDDDLTQDILDQFDLVCSQHNSALPSVHPAKLDKLIHVPGKLQRTTSLDQNVSDVAIHAPDPIRVNIAPTICRPPDNSEESTRMQKEVATLREELYMRLGELATMRETTNKVNAAKADTIVRLESSLTREREDFQRRLNELTTKLAFREADYHLATNELVQLKDQLNTTKSTLKQETRVSTAAEFSPASQLIASAFSPFARHNTPPHAVQPVAPFSPGTHLPVPVTPVPSRRRARQADGVGTWKVRMAPKPEQQQSTFPDDSLNGLVNGADKNDAARGLLDMDHINETPRKRPRFEEDSFNTSGRCMDIGFMGKENERPCCVDVGVETDQPTHCPFTRPSDSFKLRLRITRTAIPPTIPASKNTLIDPSPVFPNPTPTDLAMGLMRLAVVETNKDIEHPPAMALSNALGSHKTAIQPYSALPELTWCSTDRYLQAMQTLILPTSQSDTMTGRLATTRQTRVMRYATVASEVADNLLDRVEEVVKVLPTLMHTNPFSRVLRNPNPKEAGEYIANASGVPEACVMDDNGVDDAMGGLTEDPFAGAPASQMVAPLNQNVARKNLSRLIHLPPTMVASSAPARLHPPSSDHLPHTTPNHLDSTSHMGQSPSITEHPALHKASLGLRQLHHLLHTLRSWNVILENCWPLTDNGDAQATGIPANPMQNLLHAESRLGKLVSTLVDSLADKYISYWQSVHCHSKQTHLGDTVRSDALSTTPTVYSSSNTTQKSTSSFSMAASAESPFDGSLSPYTWLICTMALDTAALTASLLHPNSIRPSGLKWPLSFQNCLILATSTCDGTVRSSCSSDAHELSSCAVDRAKDAANCLPTELKPVVALIRLARSMVTSGHWDLGHQATNSSWWTMNLDGTPVGVQSSTPDSLNQDRIHVTYLRHLFDTRVTCRLLMLVTWIGLLANRYDGFAQGQEGNVTECLAPEDAANDMDCVDLLHEFSGLIGTLVQRDATVWSDTCPCKARVYSTLIRLADSPLRRLLSLPLTISFLSHASHTSQIQHRLLSIQSRCVAALGQLVRTLTALLWRHGDSAFQTHTDHLPSYFFLVSSLSRWAQQSRVVCTASACSEESPVMFDSPPSSTYDSVLRPELVEELYDFESTSEVKTD